MTETKPLGTWHRPLPPSIANPTFFDDPSRTISEALGKAALSRIGAHQIHRIGLMNGIGFMLPANNGPFNHVQIIPQRKQKWDGKCYVYFLRTFQPEDLLCKLETERVETVQTTLGELKSMLLEKCS